MKFETKLKKLCDKRGLRFSKHAQGHYVIKGGDHEVNYYPESKKRTAFIHGFEAEHRVTPERAVEMAGENRPFDDVPFSVPGDFEPKRKPAKREPEKMYQQPQVKGTWQELRDVAAKMLKEHFGR